MRGMRGLLVAVFLGVALVAPSARAAVGPEETVQDFYGALLNAMKRGTELGERGRYEALLPVVQRDFDITAMSRLSVGASWSRLSPAEQDSIKQAFARYTTATYADRFRTYSGQRFEVAGTQRDAYGTMVNTNLIPVNGQPVKLNYLMRQSGGQWLIADVYLSGTISQLASLRSQFGAVLDREGPNGLVEALNRKAEMLVANAATAP
jgi:phospholipid transport system substrate-binding protein